MTGPAHDQPTAGQRYKVLAGATMANMVSQTPAVHSVFGLFLIPLSDAFGWSRASISGGLGLMALISAIAYPLVGRYADRHGAWRIVLMGNILFASAMAGMALLNGALWHYYLLFALLSLAAALPNPALFKKMVIDCYGRDFGVAVGISGGSGIGLGAAIIPVIAAIVMAAYGWRITYVAIGAVMLATGLFAILVLLRDVRGQKHGGCAGVDAPLTDDAAGLSPLPPLYRSAAFWMILIAFAFMSGVMGAIFGHIVPIAAERGIGVAVATAAVSACALANVVWQPAMGWLIDRFPGPRTILLPYACAFVGIAMLAMARSPAVLIAGGTLVGIGVATQFCSMSMMAVRYFGAARYGSVIGLLYSAMFIGSGISPILLDAIFDAQGSYRLALTGAIGLQLVGFVLVAMLPRFRADADGHQVRPTPGMIAA